MNQPKLRTSKWNYSQEKRSKSNIETDPEFGSKVLGYEISEIPFP